MKILYFGAYDKNYSRNKIILDGLKKNHTEIYECHIKKPTFKSESKLTFFLYILFTPLIILYRNLILNAKGYYIYLRKNIDIIFVGYPAHLDIISAFFIKKLSNKKIVLDSLDSIYDTFVLDRKLIKNKFLITILFKIEKFLYKLPDMILTDTGSNKKFLAKTLQIPKNKIRILYVGAENKIYKPLKKQRANKIFTVIFYGFASPLHGIEYIIKAAKICEEKKEKIKFILLGNGQTTKKDVSLAKKLGIKNIDFLPSMKEEKAAKIVQKADIFLGVFKGNSKSLRVIPNKVFQGIAMAKPVITEDCSGIREIFENKKNIYLCKPADSEDLARKIITLYKDKDLRQKIAKSGSKLYKSNFTPKIIGEKLEVNLKKLVI